jgi:hypothetical protein
VTDRIEHHRLLMGLTPEFGGAGAARFVRAQAMDRRPLEWVVRHVHWV